MHTSYPTPFFIVIFHVAFGYPVSQFLSWFLLLHVPTENLFGINCHNFLHVNYTIPACHSIMRNHCNVTQSTYINQELDNRHPHTINFATTHTHTHTTVLWFYGFCLGQPEWAGPEETFTHTPIIVITCPLSASSIYYDLWHPPCLIHVPDSLFPQSPSFLWFTSWPGTLHFKFILHTFLHPIIVFFSQHMPIPSQPVSL